MHTCSFKLFIADRTAWPILSSTGGSGAAGGGAGAAAFGARGGISDVFFETKNHAQKLAKELLRIVLKDVFE